MKGLILAIQILFAISTLSFGAVSSTGEINVEGNDEGVVFASSSAVMTVALIIDRSQAEPGEEIKTIRIFIPAGFTVKADYLRSVKLNGKEVKGVKAIADDISLRVVLPELITDVNTYAEITFKADTPPHELPQRVVFDVLLLNFEDKPIGEFVKPGNADGRDNNDSFALAVRPNVPPPPPAGFNAQPDPRGENDVLLTWKRSEDPDVRGYYVYRDGEKVAQVPNPKGERVEWKEINVPPGRHIYHVEAFKTELIRSQPSNKVELTVKEDTSPPYPPSDFKIKESEGGFEIYWSASPSEDVVRYNLYFGTSRSDLQIITSLERSKIGDEEGYKFFHTPPRHVKSFLFAVEAVDEVGLTSQKLFQERHALTEPYPNPFTPLSPDPAFNRVTFSAAAIEGAEGEFSVKIFDLKGRLIVELKDETGEGRISWDGKVNGQVAESGIYIYQIRLGDRYKVGTIILAK